MTVTQTTGTELPANPALAEALRRAEEAKKAKPARATTPTAAPAASTKKPGASAPGDKKEAPVAKKKTVKKGGTGDGTTTDAASAAPDQKAKPARTPRPRKGAAADASQQAPAAQTSPPKPPPHVEKTRLLLVMPGRTVNVRGKPVDEPDMAFDVLTVATIHYVDQATGFRPEVVLRPRGWKGDLPADAHVLALDMPNFPGSFNTSFRNKEGRVVGALRAAVTRFGSQAHKTVGTQLADLLEPLVGRDSVPAEVMLKAPGLLGGWDGVRQNRRDGFHRVAAWGNAFRDWFQPLVREEADKTAAAKIFKGSVELGKGKGVLVTSNLRPGVRAKLLDSKIHGARFILEASADGKVQALVVGSGSKAGAVEGAWKILLSKKEEDQDRRWRWRPSDGYVVCYLDRGSKTSLDAKEVLEAILAAM